MGLNSTSFSPGFCVRRLKQHDRIGWELDLISGFFVFLVVDCLGRSNQH